MTHSLCLVLQLGLVTPIGLESLHVGFGLFVTYEMAMGTHVV